jgi:predicted GNAT family acetyltransferase
MDDAEIIVRDNEAQHRYEILVDGDLAGFSAYREDAGHRVFTHTKVDDDYEGQGIGSALAKGALDDTRRRGLSVVARCPFVAAYIQRHPEYTDLLHA